MAHRPIGAGISLTTGAASAMTTSFTAQTNVVRVVAVSAGAFVAIGTNPTATTADGVTISDEVSRSNSGDAHPEGIFTLRENPIDRWMTDGINTYLEKTQ